MTTFVKEQHGFKGLGWTKIIADIKKHNNVLIGEDHFTNEIPFFFTEIATKVKFDNFFAEIDPFSAHLLQEKIKMLSPEALKNYVRTYGNTFSFYALNPEFELMKKLVKNNTKLQGTDQILLVADRLIGNELAQTTTNKKAKAIYETIATSSKTYFDNFLKDQSKPFYLLTSNFQEQLNALSLLQLSKEEIKIIEALKLSVKIYKSQDHHLRVQLMKNQLMAVYKEWINKKNLFKYGANHMTKGESILEIYDIGNLVNNIADSQFQTSLHIMIIGKSGMQASPFQGHPAEKVDENTGNLSSLKPFFKLIDGEKWYCFDMVQIRAAIAAKKIKVDDITLSRIIKGYDILVIIPTVTAAQFPN